MARRKSAATQAAEAEAKASRDPIAVRTARHVDTGVKAVAKAGARTAGKYKKTSIVLGAYTAGAVHSSWARKKPEFYDSTPNKGRAEDKHPRSFA